LRIFKVILNIIGIKLITILVNLLLHNSRLVYPYLLNLFDGSILFF